jgi:DNA-binding transcriptional MerR regulator
MDSGTGETGGAKDAEGAANEEFTIDQLAAVSQVPSRTIRYYQSAGALPGPVIRGRVAYYGPNHVERLKLVAELQDRGLRIKAICELVKKIDKGELDLGEWLGLEAQLGEPWANDTPRVVTEHELYELVGKSPVGLLAQLRRLKLIEGKGDSILIPSPGMLQAVMRLETAGVDLETAVAGLDIIKKHAKRAAKDLAKYFFKRAAAGFGRDASAAELAEAFGALRPVSQEALQLSFGQEMERVLRDLSESGKSTSMPKRKKRAQDCAE